MDDADALPSYRKPPVSEVALSVDFQPLAKWSVLQFGAYWELVRAEYPDHDVRPPLRSVIERFGPDRWDREGDLVEWMTGLPEIRCWFTSPDGRLIQVQRDRFVFNWRQIKGDESYPRYAKAVRPTFQREWERFLGFLDVQGLGMPEVRQCEITYVNDIPQGQGWETIGDLPKVLAVWRDRGSDGFLPPAETGGVNMSYPMPGERGRLHATVQHVRRADKANGEFLQLKLTARGAPEAGDADGILGWMDLGREWVVRGFSDLTTPVMHKLWERER